MELEDTLNVLWEDVKFSIDDPVALEVALDEFKTTVLQKTQEMTEEEKNVLKSSGPLPDTNTSYLRLAMHLISKTLGEQDINDQAFLPTKNEVEKLVEGAIAKSLTPLHQEVVTTQSLIHKMNTDQVVRKIMHVSNERADTGSNQAARPTAEEYIHSRLSKP